MINKTHEPVTPTQIEELTARIKPMLAGYDPAAQSAVLADLLATWIAGHHPAVRAEVLRLHDQLVRDLIADNEKEIFGSVGHPGWRDMGEPMQ